MDNKEQVPPKDIMCTSDITEDFRRMVNYLYANAVDMTVEKYTEYGDYFIDKHIRPIRNINKKLNNENEMLKRSSEKDSQRNFDLSNRNDELQEETKKAITDTAKLRVASMMYITEISKSVIAEEGY